MPCLNEFKAPLKTLIQALLKQETRTPENQNLQGNIFERIFVPKSLDDLGPPYNLLYFIDNKKIFPKRLCLKPSLLPLALQPCKGVYAQSLCKSVCERLAIMLQGLLDGSRLANLPGPGDNLNPKPFLI